MELLAGVPGAFTPTDGHSLSLLDFSLIVLSQDAGKNYCHFHLDILAKFMGINLRGYIFGTGFFLNLENSLFFSTTFLLICRKNVAAPMSMQNFEKVPFSRKCWRF